MANALKTHFQHQYLDDKDHSNQPRKRLYMANAIVYGVNVFQFAIKVGWVAVLKTLYLEHFKLMHTHTHYET